jgi:hypothetical protein
VVEVEVCKSEFKNFGYALISYLLGEDRLKLFEVFRIGVPYCD